MSEPAIQSVLRCPRCNKPFDKQSTLKRHGYYCQSRRGGAPPPRTRSCIPCAHRKRKCDNARPACSGCLNRPTQCQYPANTSSGTARSRPKAQLGSDIPAEPQQAAPLDPGLQDSVLDDVLLDDTLTSTPYLAWDDSLIELADLITPQSQSESAHVLEAPVSSSDAPGLTPVPTTAVATPQDLQLFSPPSFLSIPKELPFLFTPLMQRPKAEVTMQRTASLVMHQLKSFPLMMLNGNGSLPPFIHPRLLLTSGSAETDEMEPLHNCISLLHMMGSQVPGSRKLFWRNVRVECERFLQERRQWSMRGLVAGLQALSVYLILRLGEGQTENTDFDSLLLAAVVAISTQLGRLEATSSSHPPSNWDDWIIEESKRRLCTIYQIIDLLFYFEPAIMCDMRRATDLVIAPLPAKRLLWEATDEGEWKAQAERVEEDELRGAFALAANGELVKVEDRSVFLHCTTEGAGAGGEMEVYTNTKPRVAAGGVERGGGSLAWRRANWDEWCSGMDGFGGLVMLAASLTV